MNRSRLLLALAALAALDVLLFVPAFAVASPRPALLPTFQDAHGAWELFKQLLLRRANQDPFRLSAELTGFLAAVLWFPTARWLRRLTVGWYGLTLLLLGYQHGFQGFFLREPALWEDWRLLRNLFHYVGDQFSLRWAAAILGGALAAGAVLLTLAAALEAVAERSSKPLRIGALVLLTYALAVTAWFGRSRPEALAQLSIAPLLHNAEVSGQRKREFEELAQGPIDTRYQAFSQVKLQRRPNVALMMIEAYGELANACDTGPAYRVLLRRIEEQLAAAGYHARSAYSRAPVYGGQSWLSIASVQLGMRIDTARKFELVENVGAQTPSLTRFFKEQGYFTAAVQPGNTLRTGLKGFDVFNRALNVDAPELDYRGFRYGWQGIPDQYTLGRIGELLPTFKQPWLLFSMSVSTHHPWEAPFVFVDDWKALQDEHLDTQAVAAPWEPIAERAEIGEERRGYFRTVEYEWRGLAKLMEGEPGADTVFLVLGDHQPSLPCEGDKPVSWNTPLHVISRDAALLERFAALGFDAGLVPTVRAQPLLVHEGLFSTLVGVFAAAWGDGAQVPLPQAPEGISLRSLYR